MYYFFILGAANCDASMLDGSSMLWTVVIEVPSELFSTIFITTPSQM